MRRIAISVWVAVCFFPIAVTAKAATIHVPSDQPSIQAGIDVALEGDTVLVGPGTYAGDGNRDIEFGGKNLVVMSSGDPEITIIDCQGSRELPHRAFYLHSGEYSGSIIEGFTIRGGYAPVYPYGDYLVYNIGGAIALSGASPTIRYCRFLENSAFYGGAIGCIWGASPTLEWCVIGRNRATTDSWCDEVFCYPLAALGGGIYCDETSSPRIQNCTLIENICEGHNDLQMQPNSTGHAVWGTGYFLEGCIVAYNGNPDVPSRISGPLTGFPVLNCTDVFGNIPGDWIGNIYDQQGVNGNFSADPLFCGFENDDLHINSLSPCAPQHNLCSQLVGALEVGCGPLARMVSVDIRPGACPNPINTMPATKGKSVIPVAILGAADVDVNDIDASSLVLEGVTPLRWSHEDVAAPAFDAGECNCTTEGPDGFMDLTLKFSRTQIIDALGTIHHGDEITLTLTGNLLDGTPIEGTDCVVVRGHNDNEENPSGDNTDRKSITSIANHPNPFNASTVITYTLKSEGQVYLEIFDVLGRKVSTLVNGFQSPGPHAITWDGKDGAGSTVASGMYFYRLHSGDGIETRKMLLMK